MTSALKKTKKFKLKKIFFTQKTKKMKYKFGLTLWDTKSCVKKEKYVRFNTRGRRYVNSVLFSTLF